MAYAVLKKGTLLIAADGAGKSHLFAILNDPHGQEREVLLASFSTYRPSAEYYCDETCRVGGEKKHHPFLIVDSFVRYQKLRIVAESKLLNGVAQKVMAPQAPLNQVLFDRVCQGVFDSPYSALKFQTFLSDARKAGC
jgi:hypothetical protein